MASAIGNVASAIGNAFEHLFDRSLRFLDQFARPVLWDALWRVGCEVVVGVRGRRTLWDGRGRSACVIFGSCWMRADVGLPAKVRPADRVARIMLSAPSGQAAVAEAARREKVCEQPIGRCKAGVTEADKTAPGDRENPGPWPCGAECEAEIEDLALAPSKTAAELQCWKSGGSARPFQRPRGNPDRRENAGLEGSANCLTFPKRTWRRRQARARERRLVKGPGTP